MLEIEIDGKKAQVPDGSTVMDAAQQLGVYIPHFCYHKKLSIAANCRMCLVQVEKAPKPLPACATPVTNGMKVFTHSELAVKAQKGVMEFLLINHPLDCPICDQGGECQLQDMSVGYGPMTSRYTEEKHVVFHKNVGPLISMEEMSRCIHCTRCVRFGQEIAGVMELGMANRNMHSEITTFLGRTVDSELSGNVIDLCPVGALTSKPFRYTARTWELQRRKSISPHDSVGANLTVQVKHDCVMRVLPLENEAVNECWISDKERFSYQSLNSDKRLTKPMVKQGGEWVEVDWNVALDYVAHGLNDVKREFGGEAISVLVGPTATNEEYFLLGKLSKALGVGELNFSPRHSSLSGLASFEGTPWLGMRLTELAGLDSLLVVGSFFRKDHPLIAQRVRQAAKKGLEVNFLSMTGDDPLIKTHQKIVSSPQKFAESLGAIVAAAYEIKALGVPAAFGKLKVEPEHRIVALSLINGDKKSVLLGNSCWQGGWGEQIVSAAQALCEISGAVLGVLGDSANFVGASYIKTKLGLQDLSKRVNVQPSAVVLYGLNPELDVRNPTEVSGIVSGAKLVVAFSSFKEDALLACADAILPIAPFTETSGSYVNIEGRIQGFNGVVKPLGDARPGWKVLRVLGNVLNIEGFAYTSSEEVRSDIFGDNQLDSLNDLTPLKFTATIGSQPIEASVQSTVGFRIADVPIHFTDSLARHAPALQATADARKPAIRISSSTLSALGLAGEKAAKVSQGGKAVVLPIETDEMIPEGGVFVSAAHPATSQLGEMFGPITVERA